MPKISIPISSNDLTFISNSPETLSVLGSMGITFYVDDYLANLESTESDTKLAGLTSFVGL